MWEPGIFVLVFTAIVVGWYLGRKSYSSNDSQGSAATLQGSYFKGINYLINEQPDNAIETFIQALDVNAETFELHIGLGNLLRRKGEVDRAIRIHQNLLARPNLHRQHLHSAHLELARDYISAGLFDRAESLLEDLVNNSADLRETCLQHLLEIYQLEKDWDKAIETADKLKPKKRFKRDEAKVAELGRSVAHFYCEEAEQAFTQGVYQEAHKKLQSALAADKHCARASLILGRLELELRQPKRAIKALKRIRNQDSAFLPETIELFRTAYEQLGDPQGFQKYWLECSQEISSVSIALTITREIEAIDGDIAAGEYLAKHLKTRPSLKGLSQLIEYHLRHSEGRARENISLLRDLIDALIETKPLYQCRHCGFTGNSLHWLCPSCKCWGEIKTIQGVEGD